jgi:hypothetical protein
LYKDREGKIKGQKMEEERHFAWKQGDKEEYRKRRDTHKQFNFSTWHPQCYNAIRTVTVPTQ